MNIKLNNVGKRFGRNWVFRNLSFSVIQGNKYAVLGPNGSGKSTLLKVVSGNVTPSEGTLEYACQTGKVGLDVLYKSVSIAAPYLELPEEYSLHELLAFHKDFKPFQRNMPENEVMDIIELSHTKEKEFKFFSSGMKQRVKLALAILSQSPLLLLDEPSTALDAKSVAWYNDMIKNYGSGKTIVVFSNNKEEEYGFCNEKISIT